MITETFTVSGLSCQHCVATVTEAVEALPGVHDVHVDLPTGQLNLTSETASDPTLLGATLEHAGYALQRQGD